MTTEATCTEAGEKTRTCKICGNEETQEIEALGHDYAEAWTNDEDGHWHVCEREGCDAKSNADSHSEVDHYCSICEYKTSEHSYTVTYTWSADYQSCTATKECANCSEETEGHKQTASGTVTSSVTQEATCEQPELTTYVATFEETWAETQTKADVETKAKTEHTYGEASYVWNDNHTSCSAMRDCTVCSEETEGHTQTTVATVESEVVQNATCTLPELTTYTATFDEDWAQAQTAEKVQTGEALGHTYGATSYDWNELSYPDGVRVTCTATRECTLCTMGDDYKQTAVAMVSSEVVQEATCVLPELTTYTATFEEEWAETQLLERWWTGNELGHEYGEPEYTWNDNHTSCVATRECTVCSEETEGHKQTANGTISSTVTQEVTCEKPELTNYVAVFEENWAIMQLEENVQTKAALNHNYSEAWTNDETNHWHVCLNDDCTSISEKAAHTFTEGLCTTCNGYDTTGTAGLKFGYTGSSYKVTVGYTGTETDIKIPYYYNDGISGYALVTAIDSSAFKDNTTIQNVTLQGGVTTIDESAFQGCTSLNSILIPSSVTTIDDSAFQGCTKLKIVSLTSGLLTIGSYAFCNCTSLSAMTIPDTVKAIGTGAFSYCTSLTGIQLSRSLRRIESMTFMYCSSLKTINLPESLTEISDYAFERCDSLTILTIPEACIMIGNAAFRACTTLTSVTLPRHLMYIYDYAFAHCYSLRSMIYQGTTIEWEKVEKKTNWCTYSDKLSSVTCTNGSATLV